MTGIEVQETEEQAAARIRRSKARAALRAAPETAARLRLAAIPNDGRTEKGELTEWRTPLITAAADAADALFVNLRDWVEIWGDRLELDVRLDSAWRRADETPMGFRAGVTPERASMLVSSVASWLLWHDEQIAAHEGAEYFHDKVTGEVWAKGDKVANSTRVTVTEWSHRPCPTCGAEEVRAEFFGEPMESAEARGEAVIEALDGVSVRCAQCGWMPTLRLSQVARWLS